jgi:hypothetical protein
MCSIHYVSKTEETIDKSLLVVSVKRNTSCIDNKNHSAANRADKWGSWLACWMLYKYNRVDVLAEHFTLKQDRLKLSNTFIPQSLPHSGFWSDTSTYCHNGSHTFDSKTFNDWRYMYDYLIHILFSCWLPASGK